MRLRWRRSGRPSGMESIRLKSSSLLKEDNGEARCESFSIDFQRFLSFSTLTLKIHGLLHTKQHSSMEASKTT